MNNIPMSFFPLEVSKNLSKPLHGLGQILSLGFPHFDIILKESDFIVTKDDFFSITLLNTIIWWILSSGALIVVFNVLSIKDAFLMGPTVGILIAVLVLLRIILNMQVLINKKVNSIDANLIFGLKMMLVEINAGVSLFDSIVMVSSYKLGETSNAFKEIAKRLNAGEREDEVLKDVAAKNPSAHLKKTLYQIVSGLKVGSPISKIIEESLDSLEREQKNSLIEYGSTLRVFTLVFMMLGVIIPSMGLAFLLVLNSLPGMNIPPLVPYLLIGIVAVLEIMLIGFIKSKRPNLLGSV